MHARIHLITLAVDDLEAALGFYRDGLGLESPGIIGTELEGDDTQPAGTVAMFELHGGLILAVYPRAELAKDAGIVLEASFFGRVQHRPCRPYQGRRRRPPRTSRAGGGHRHPSGARPSVGASTPATSATWTGTCRRSCRTHSSTRWMPEGSDVSVAHAHQRLDHRRVAAVLIDLHRWREDPDHTPRAA
jgi:catechol 2,3-dioxygenase-like lactoylglutathione lyase family enzyme